jgi:hypothetical protein
MEKINIQPRDYQEEIIQSVTGIKASRAISKKDSFGIPLPLWKDQEETEYFLSEQNILDLPKSIIKNKKIIPALLIFNLIADHHLGKYFTIEEFIDSILLPQGDEKSL